MTPQLIQILVAILSGGAVLEAVRYALNRRWTARKDVRDTDKQEFDQLQAMRDQLDRESTQLREELRKDRQEIRQQMAELAEQVTFLRAELDSWKRRYYTLYMEHTRLSQQYVLLSTSQEAMLIWLKTRGIEIPIQMPVIVQPSQIELPDISDIMPPDLHKPKAT
jgi:uncharacterized protein (DUF3084 family)